MIASPSMCSRVSCICKPEPGPGRMTLFVTGGVSEGAPDSKDWLLGGFPVFFAMDFPFVVHLNCRPMNRRTASYLVSRGEVMRLRVGCLPAALHSGRFFCTMFLLKTSQMS